MITEVNPKVNSEGLQESEFSLAGYNIYSVNIGTLGRRGIIIYIDERLKSCEINVASDFSEFLIVKIYMANDKTLNLGSLYRSPSSCINNDDNLLNLLDTISRSSRDDIIMIGDFNYKNIDWLNHVAYTHSTVSEKQFVSNLQDNLLPQHVTFPTGARGPDIPSTLDFVISNNDSIDNIFNLSPLGKSDHSVLQVECNMTFKVDKKCKLNFNKGDYSALRNFIQLEFQTEEANTILGTSYICVEDQWQYFKKSLNAGIEKYIP